MYDSLSFIYTASSIMRTWISGLRCEQCKAVTIIHLPTIRQRHPDLRYLAGEL